jgi:hypothetical protein
MSVYPGVVVPAVPPRPPQLTLIGSSVRPDNKSDPPNPVLQIGDDQLALLPDDQRKEIEAQQRDSWVRGIAYAPENHFPAVAHDPCDFGSVSGSVDEPALPAPTGLALQQSSGGTLANGAYEYQVTAVDANGETTALAATAITVSAGGGTASVILTWNKVESADSNIALTYNVYGRVSGSIGKLATVGPFDADEAATYTDTGSASPGAAPPSSNTTGGPGSYTNLPIVNYQPVLLVVEDWCSTFGFSERDFKGRALRLLEAAQYQALEHELWTGALAQAQSYPNNYLDNGSAANFIDLTPATPPSVARGQQILQDYLAQQGFGGQGMIHCQAQTAPNLLNARRVGSLLLDIFDNIIVPGVGYPGTAANVGTPSSTTAVMFATDLVMTRVEEEGTVFPDTFAEAIDWGQSGFPNTIRFRAMKFAAAYWDGAVQAGCRVTLET